MARSTYDDFLIKDKIGSGSYGVVYKVIRKVDRQTYAMKEIDLQGMSRKEQEECIRETRVLSSLDSDFIIKYYDSFLERGRLYIITEYAGNGNLHDYIKRQKARLAEDLIWRLFIQILLGLNHMHSKKILHRDIKTLNVFLDDQLNVKLGDMGVAKILSTNTNFAKTIVGTPYYLSPELCEDKPYNEKSDVWALGVVLYECLTQRHPFDADNQGALILKILRGKYPPVTGYSPDICDLIKRCLTQNANRRPNTYKLLLLPSIRQKAEEAGLTMPDQATLAMFADRVALKPKAPAPAAVAAEPGRPMTPSSGGQDAAAAQQAVRDLPNRPPSARQGGVIRVVGDMNAPPLRAEASQAAAPPPGNEDKAFVFGATMQAQQPVQQRASGHVNVSVSGVEATDGAVDSGNHGEQPLEAAWRVDNKPGPGPAYQAWGDAAKAAEELEVLHLEGEDGEEDEEGNPYDDPNAYGEDDEGEEDEDGYEDDEAYDGGVGDPTSSGGHYDEEEPHWVPDPTRVSHMKSAMMIQRAACLDLVGEKAFNELYALLKSNQVDEASMTDLSRLVFKIIPYDKSEVIQMMYKLLYLESQLETGA